MPFSVYILYSSTLDRYYIGHTGDAKKGKPVMVILSLILFKYKALFKSLEFEGLEKKSEHG